MALKCDEDRKFNISCSHCTYLKRAWYKRILGLDYVN